MTKFNPREWPQTEEEILKSAEEIKSWNSYDNSEYKISILFVVAIISILVIVICAILATPLIITSV